MDLLHPSGWLTWCAIYEVNMWWVSVIVRQDINYPKLPPRNVNWMDERRPFQSSDLINYSLMVSCWNCLMTRWPHPVPDGQGQILLSNMDTWAPERQLSKSCVRLASKNSPDLNKAAIRHFWLLNPLDFCLDFRQFTFQTMETIILITMLFDFSSVINSGSSHHFMFSVFGHHSAASYISLAGHFAEVHAAPHQRGA